MSNSIRQKIVFQAPVNRVYQALTRNDQFAEFSGGPAEISPEAGGAFTCFGGQVTGRNIELTPNQRVVQAWRVGPWAEGAWSIVRFELKATDDGTELVLDHAGFPEEAREHLEGGWHKMYWEPLRQFLS
jgi:uncharacterized protein YndB with AHSA1/START domain